MPLKKYLSFSFVHLQNVNQIGTILAPLFADCNWYPLLLNQFLHLFRTCNALPRYLPLQLRADLCLTHSLLLWVVPIWSKNHVCLCHNIINLSCYFHTLLSVILLTPTTACQPSLRNVPFSFYHAIYLICITQGVLIFYPRNEQSVGDNDEK